MKFFAYMFYLCCLSYFFAAAQAEPLHIVAAENFYGGIAQQIAGPSATVDSILTNPNQDPHEFTTNAATAKDVADADIVIYSGIDYDPWMDQLLGTPGKPGRVVIKVSDLVGATRGGNPHLWYHPRTMPALAAKLVEVLSEIKPDQAASYHQHQDEFNASMKTLLAKITAMQATTRVFGYMAHALCFVMLNGDFQIKIMNEAEPTADETAAFEQSLTSKTVKLLLYNSQVTDPTTERMQKLARDSGVPVVGVTETQPPDQKSYVDWMTHQLDDIAAALSSKSP
jgi:zinc/manganese transport system substrate-binding protein